MTAIAILGLGAMGSRIAQRFIAAGYETHVWNRSPAASETLVKAGATAHATPRETAARARVVMSIVRDDQASRDVWLNARIGAALGLKPGSIAIESSTLSAGWVCELASRLANQCEFVEAPVVGSRPQAEAGQLIYLLGGSEQAISAVKPILDVSGSKQLHCGEPRAGAAVKLAANAFFAVQASALGELFASLKSQGIDHARAAELFAELPTTSPVALGISKLIAANHYAPLFPVELVLKDLSYQVAESATPVVSATHKLFEQAVDQGLGDLNIHAVARLFQ